MESKNRHVYSSDKSLNQRCARCKELISECQCRVDEKVNSLDKIIVCISIEKSGRAGKAVTIVSRLPNSLEFLKALLSELKQKCGAGGTSYFDAKKQGCIEIQGDQRQVIRQFLEKKGIKVKN